MHVVCLPLSLESSSLATVGLERHRIQSAFCHWFLKRFEQVAVVLAYYVLLLTNYGVGVLEYLVQVQ